MSQRYVLHGLSVQSEVPLDPRRQAQQAIGQPDLTVRLGDGEALLQPTPETVPLVDASVDGRQLYTLWRQENGFLLRVHSVADFTLDPEVTQVDVHAPPLIDAALIPILISGMVISIALQLRGRQVLHASAVELDDGAIAFVGRSGMGKSTAATLLCLAGGKLITDDVLRVEHEPHRALCFAGATETRLRRAAWELAGRGEHHHRRETADGRLALGLPQSEAPKLELRAIVIPRPDREATVAHIQRLRAAGGLTALLGFPRIIGWCDPRTARQQFTDLAELVRKVPVAALTIPWGPPFAESLPDEVRMTVSDALRCWSAARTARL